jgi:hypothetical protein
MKLKSIVITALILIGLCGCRSTGKKGLDYETMSEIKTSIHENVDDPQRASQMLDLINDFQKEGDRTLQKMRISRTQAVTLSDDYSTNREELDAVYEEIGLLTRKLCNLVKDNHFEIKELCTEKEWESITGNGKRLFKF